MSSVCTKNVYHDYYYNISNKLTILQLESSNVKLQHNSFIIIIS